MKRLWLDLGEWGLFSRVTEDTELWQDHGLALLRTIMHAEGVYTDVCATRNIDHPDLLADIIRSYDMLIMNVRSYNWPQAQFAARVFKSVNPTGWVVVGGMHATVAIEEMIACADLDRICIGAGEKIIAELSRSPEKFERIFEGPKVASMAEWPTIDRNLWPKPKNQEYPYPFEPSLSSWGSGPMVSLLTSRVCPWRCSFCNEMSYIPNMDRRPVDSIIEELNHIEDTQGPIGSLVIHDSMFFQQPHWLEEWLDKYPRLARRRWPYWAAARADTVRKWPELFKSLVRETNWNLISIGLESGSNNVLRTLNKECTAEDNVYAIGLINQLGDELESEGRIVKLYSNIILGTPGETERDILDTVCMSNLIKRPLLSLAYYAPYPGSALGYQISAEGKSLIVAGEHNRSMGNRFVKDIDYELLDAVSRGHFNKLAHDAMPEYLERVGQGKTVLDKIDKFNKTRNIYVFELYNGGKKISFGSDAQDAFDTLALRLKPEELANVNIEKFKKIHQKEIHAMKFELR